MEVLYRKAMNTHQDPDTAYDHRAGETAPVFVPGEVTVLSPCGWVVFVHAPEEPDE